MRYIFNTRQRKPGWACKSNYHYGCTRNSNLRRMWILVKPSVRINCPNLWIPYIRFPQSIWVLVTHLMTIGYWHYSSTFRTCALSCLTTYRLIYTYDHSEFTLIRMRVNSTTLVKTFCIYFQFPQIILLALISSMWHFNRRLV